MIANFEKTNQAPLADGLFFWPSDEPKLIATKCKSCGSCFFPKTYNCQNPNCDNGDVEDIYLSKRGKLASYTIGYYPCPPPFVNPDPFVPYGVGLVTFPEGISILGQIVDCDPEKDLRVGLDVEVVIDTLYQDIKGNEVLVWKFRLVK